jgi:hypothetical protein
MKTAIETLNYQVNYLRGFLQERVKATAGYLEVGDIYSFLELNQRVMEKASALFVYQMVLNNLNGKELVESPRASLEATITMVQGMVNRSARNPVQSTDPVRNLRSVWELEALSECLDILQKHKEALTDAEVAGGGFKADPK